ncbi:2468_t:CDS:2, partial [Entrophospora sp. SA101]
STDKSIFIFWNIMINPNEQIYWKQWERFNVGFWALHICLFSALGNRTLKLKELLNEALCSNSFMDEDIEIPDHNSVKISYLRNQYPSNGTIYDHNNSICKISHFNNYTVYLNADECLIVSKDNFVKFYGNVYSSRAQFAASKVCNPLKTFINLFAKKAFFAGGDKICINSTNFWKLRVLDGVGEIIANEISSERDKRKFDVDDLCKRIKKFPKISLDCIKNLKNYNIKNLTPTLDSLHIDYKVLETLVRVSDVDWDKYVECIWEWNNRKVFIIETIIQGSLNLSWPDHKSIVRQVAYEDPAKANQLEKSPIQLSTRI